MMNCLVNLPLWQFAVATRCDPSNAWPIPNAWRVAGDSVTTNLFSHRSSYDQRFELRPDGTVSIEKFDYVLMRGTNTSDVAIRRL